jgi:WD40 repeat protein
MNQTGLSQTDTFYITGGNVPADALSYVTRDADALLLQHLLQGQFCYILTSRQMGKSSLMTQMVKRLREHNVAPAVLDLSNQGFNLDARQWYNGLLEQLGRRLKLDDEIEDFCSDHRSLSPLQLWQQALRDVVLEAMPDQQVVIFIDEIDVVRSLPFSTDEFFAAIRACYNARTEDSTFARLSFCLLGVATPADLISNPKLTPFNIGTRIELTDFSREEARSLEVGLGQDAAVNRMLMDRILYWTSGHPYLTQRLCQAVAADDAHLTERSVDGCAEHLFLSVKAQRQDSNLSFVQQRMLPMEEEQRVGLLTLYAKVLSGKSVLDSDTIAYVSELKLAGIVQAVDGRLQVRNRIYSQVFDRGWINENMPGAELRRQRAAYHRGLLLAGGLAATVLTIISSLAFIAVSQANRANKNANNERIARVAADNNAERAERTAYIANMNLIQRDWDLNNIGHVLDLLEETRTSEFRGFEWGYWNRLCHLELLTLRGHSGPIDSVAFSPDGKRIVTTESALVARVWDAATGRELLTLKGHTGGVNSASFSPDSKRIITGSEDTTARVWNATTGRQLFLLKAHACVALVAFSPDGKRIITGGYDGIARVWDVSTGRETLTLKSNPLARVDSAAFSPDGTRIVTGTFDGTNSTVWDATTGRKVLTLRRHNAPRPMRVYSSSVAFSPDSKHIVTSCNDNSATIWDAITGREQLTLTGHTDAVTSVAYSPNGKRIVTGSVDTTARIWDATTGSALFILKGHTRRVGSVAFSPNGRRILAGSADGTAKVWDARAEQNRVVLKGRFIAFCASVFSPDGKRIVAGGEKGEVRVCDTTTGREILDLKEYPDDVAHAGTVYSVAFSPDGKYIVEGNMNHTTTVQDSTTGRATLTLKGHTGGVISSAFSPDGKHIVTGSIDKTAMVWDATTGHQLLILRGHAGAVYSVAFSPDGKHIITGSDDSTAKIWDAATGQETLMLKVDTDTSGNLVQVNPVTFSPDGKHIVIGGGDYTAVVWDATTGRQMLTLKGHTEGVVSIAFSPDGKRIVTGSGDRTTKVWDAVTGRELLTLMGDAGAVVFARGGKCIITGNRHGISVWKAQF